MSEFKLPRQNHIIPPNYLIDLFGRLRTSDPIIQLQVSQSDPSYVLSVTEGQVSGSGTSSTASPSTACTTLTVGANDGLRRFRTRVAGMYQAGKSLLYLFTFNLNTSGDLYFVLRSSVSGSIVETAIPQSEWNADKFDGSGLSGVNLDQTKCHIGFLAFEWLGVGDVVCGFIHNRLPNPAHIFSHANALTDVYMRTANLFPSYEIEKKSSIVTKRLGYFDDSDGVFLKQINGGNNLKVICCSLINEGAIDKGGTTFSINRAIGDTYNTGNVNTAKSLMLFRLHPDAINSRVMVAEVEVVVSTSCNYYLSVCRNPTFSGSITPNWNSLTGRSIQYDSDPVDTTVTVTDVNSSSIWTGSGSATKNTTGVGIFSISSVDYLGSKFDNTPDIWALVIQCDVPNAIVNSAVVKFIEEI